MAGTFTIGEKEGASGRLFSQDKRRNYQGGAKRLFSFEFERFRPSLDRQCYQKVTPIHAENWKQIYRQV